MIDLSNYSCDKCAREFSRHCKHCLHTAEKSPTRFKPKKKAGVQTPEFRKPTMPPVIPAKPEIKEFENYKNLIIVPKYDKLDVWQDANYIPYKYEILVGYNDIKITYKLGDGIHKWNELQEVSLEEAIAFGYIYHKCPNYRIKLEFIPTRTMREEEANKCKD